MNRLEERRREFRDFVWNHAADAFQAKLDRCAALSDQELDGLLSLLRPVGMMDAHDLAQTIRAAVDRDQAMLRRLLQFTGLTRNKIVQDIKAFVRQERLRVSLSSPAALFNSDQGATLASEYLARQVQRVFAPARGRINGAFLEMLNQATWPGYIRQERAKRMGHEAEFRLACLLKNCTLGFAPQEKADNPLCRDVVIDGMSYDLVCPAADRALLRVISTVHTANIGQYGESKDELEIRKAIAAMRGAGDRARVTLLAFIDGVGFESNRAGLDGVLNQADDFCQFRTIWKAAVLAGALEKRDVTVALPLPTLKRFTGFLSEHGAGVQDSATLSQTHVGWVEAGDGFVRVK